MKQFKQILKFELKNYFQNKIFTGITVFLMVAIVVAMFFPQISSRLDSDSDNGDSDVDYVGDSDVDYVGNSGGDSSQINENDDSLPIMLISGKNGADVKDIFAQTFTDYSVRLSDESEDTIKSKITSNEIKCAFIIDSLTSFRYFVNNLSMYDSNDLIAQELMQSIYTTTALVQGGFSPEQASEIISVQIDGKVETLGKDQMQNYFYTYIMIFALYMCILLYGQMVATNVASEKSSRAMELLITSAKPTSMIFGKVLASCLAGLTQLVCVFGTAFISFNLNKDYWDADGIMAMMFDIPLHLLIYMLIFFILGFAIYAFMYGAMGSVATKVEDVNTLVLPITMVFVVGFIIVVTAFTSSTVDSTLMKICSFIPFTSPMSMFTRIAMSTVPFYEILISIIILFISAIATGILSAKIYRMGVLLYGAKPKFKDLINGLKNS